MKALLTKTACVFLFLWTAGFSQPYITDFPAAENPMSDGGKWINGKAVGVDWNNVQTITGRAYGAAIVGGYNDCIAVLNTTYGAGQYAQGTVYRAAGYSPSGNHEVELLLLFRITANSARGYEVLWAHDGGIAIVRWNGPLGNYTALQEGPNIGAAVDGDVLRIEITNGVIKVYKNGVLRTTGPSNTTYTDGQPGMGFWPTDRGGVTPSSYGWKHYEAGALGTRSENGNLPPTEGLRLLSCSPNPFRQAAALMYSLSAASRVTMGIYSQSGSRVCLLKDGLSQPGQYTVMWNGLDQAGTRLSSGVYLARMQTGKETVSRRLLLTR